MQVAALDPLGQVDLLSWGEQRVAPRMREQLIDRLGDERVGCAEIRPLDGAVEPPGRGDGRDVADRVWLPLPGLNRGDGI